MGPRSLLVLGLCAIAAAVGMLALELEEERAKSAFVALIRKQREERAAGAERPS